MEKAQLNKMFDNLLHIGNKTNFWNPKMKPYIYGAVNGIHIINLVKTANKIQEVKEAISEATLEWKKVLIVATKLQARDAFVKLAESTGSFYVDSKWVPGLLTNFRTIRKRIASYIRLEKEFDAWSFEWLTKKELASKKLEFEKLGMAYKGLKEMKKAPDVIIVIDGVYEEQAVREANKLGIPVYAVLNTNGDDLLVNHLIPANTNSVKSLQFIAEELKDAFKAARPRTSKGTNEGRIKKMDTEEKVSGEKKAAPKKTEAKSETKTEVKKADPKKVETKKETKTEEKKVASKKTEAKKETSKEEKG